MRTYSLWAACMYSILGIRGFVLRQEVYAGPVDSNPLGLYLFAGAIHLSFSSTYNVAHLKTTSSVILKLIPSSAPFSWGVISAKQCYCTNPNSSEDVV